MEEEQRRKDAELAEQSRTVRSSSAMVTLLSAGLRKDSEDLARIALGAELASDVDLTTVEGRDKFIAGFKTKHPVLFAEPVQTTAGLPGRTDATPSTRDSMNDMIRRLSGR
jgi:hypothetical protein